MRASRSLVFLSGILGTAAVLSAAGDDPPATDPPPVEVRLPDPGAAEEPVAFEAGEGLQGFVVRVGAGGLQTPAVDGDSVFVGAGSEMRSYACLGGRLKWKAPTDDSSPSSPAVAGGRVYFNTQSCTVYALDAATGERAWSQWIAGSVATTPAVSGDVVFVSGPDNEKGAAGYKLEAYAAADGKRLFRSALRADIYSAPVVRGGRVYYGMADGTVAASDLSGKALWETKGEALAAPCPHGGRLLVAAGKDAAGVPGLVTLDAATGASGRAVATPPGGTAKMPGDEPGRKGGGAGGKPVKRPAPSPKPPTGPRDNPDGSGGGRGQPPVVVPPAAPGVPPRGPGTAFGYEGPRPCVVGETAAMASGEALLLQPVAGGETLRVPLAGPAAGSPVAAGSLVLQATQGGRLIAVDAASGKVRFELRFTRNGSPVALVSSPAVTRGRAYLGTAEGTLVAVDLPDPSADGWPMWGGGPSR